MIKEKIAVLTDSGSNILKGSRENLFVLPLLIFFNKKKYIDGVDINLEEVLNFIDEYIITTSPPSPTVIEQTLNEIKEKGYTHLIINTISSRLSKTYNLVRLIAENYEGLEIALLDTKNISKASGYTTILALELIEEGKEFKEIVETLDKRMKDNKVFFTVKTSEYLRRGGRIGFVASTIASIINLKPIISCNAEGVYYTLKKIRGYNKAISKILELSQEFIETSKSYDMTILVTKVDETVRKVEEMIKKTFAKVDNLEIVEVTPALAIHTGPEAIGIAIRKKS